MELISEPYFKILDQCVTGLEPFFLLQLDTNNLATNEAAKRKLVTYLSCTAAKMSS